MRVSLYEVGKIAEEQKNDLWHKAEYVGVEPMIYLHWSAGHYGQSFTDYHFNIDEGGEIEMTTDDLCEVLRHTWQRNTGAIGIALECCAGAVVCEDENTYRADLGDEPPTEMQIDCMVDLCAELCRSLGIPAENIMTHEEAAIEDGYGLDDEDDCRWDLAILREGEPWGSGGDTIRQMVKEKMEGM